MLPCLSSQDARDGGVVNTEPAPKRDERQVAMRPRRTAVSKAANLSDDIFRQVRVVVFVSTMGAAFRRLVSVVVQHCANPQMLGIAATRVVARVAHLLIARDWRVISQGPRKPVRAPFTLATTKESAIAISGDAACPRPTGVRASAGVNQRPEAIRINHGDSQVYQVGCGYRWP